MKIAPQKTEVVVVKNPRNIGDFGIMVEGVRVTANLQIKYLGVTLSRGLNFSRHIEAVMQRASDKCARLRRLM